MRRKVYDTVERPSVCLSVRPIIWPLQQVCCCGPGDAWRKVLGVIDTGNTVSSNNCLVLHPVVQKHSLQTSCLCPCKTNDRICLVSLLTKLSPRGGGGGETIYSSPMAVRLAADLRPSADRSAVLTSLVAASCRQPACR